VEVWGFIWLMLVLKIPVVAMLWLVWWSVQQTPEPVADDEGDGGSGRPRLPHPHDGPRTPTVRPRGPHGEPAPPAPARTRTPARSRERVTPKR
jgi:hypothetical protein